jgi:hypothetical protein
MISDDNPSLEIIIVLHDTSTGIEADGSSGDPIVQLF